MGSAFGNGQRKRKVDVGVMPPQSFLIVLQPGGEISPTRSNVSSSDPLRSAARSDQALSIQSGDAQQLHRKKKKKKKKGLLGEELVRLLKCELDCCAGHREGG